METTKVIEFIVSFIAGGLMSLAIWLLTTKFLAPKLILSPDMARTFVKDEKKNRYYLKIQNESRKRAIYNIVCYARFHFSDDSFYSLTFPPIPLLQINDDCNSYKYERKIEIKNINLDAVNKAIQQKFNSADNQINIDKFFEIEKDKGYIEIIIICYDVFSGAKRCVLSKEFNIDDVKDGYFPDGKMRVEREPNPNSSTESYDNNHH